MDVPGEDFTPHPLCSRHSVLLDEIQRDVSEMRRDQRAITERIVGNGKVGLDQRMAKQELISAALIFAVGVVFTGLVGVAITAIFVNGGKGP